MNNNLVVFLAIAIAALLIFLLSSSLRDPSKRHHKKVAPPSQTTDDGDSSVAVARQSNPKSPIQHADDSSWANVIRKFQGTSILFIQAPWCGYCQKLKPKLYEIAAKLPQDFQVIELNADQAKQAVAHFKTPFPTLILFRNPQLKMAGDYVPDSKQRLVGDHSSQEILQFLGL